MVSNAKLEEGSDREQSVLHPPHPGSRAMLKIKEKWTTSGVKENIHRSHTTCKTRKYYNDRFKWRQGQFNKVSWDSVRRARKKIKGKRPTDTSKIMMGWLPTSGMQGHVTRVFGCPRCKPDGERISRESMVQGNAGTRNRQARAENDKDTAAGLGGDNVANVGDQMRSSAWRG